MTGSALTTVIDLGAVVIILFAALIGRWRGLIRMLSGLAAFILALIGASYLAAHYSPVLAETAAPMLEARVTAGIEEVMSGENVNKLMNGYAEQESGNLQAALDETGFSAVRLDYLKELLGRLSEEHKLPQSLTDAMSERLEEMRRSFTGTVSQALSAVLKELLQPVFYGLIYTVAFLVLSIVLKFAFRFLDRLADLPGLRAVNAGGGLFLGVIEGVVLVIALAFLLRFTFAETDGVSDSRMLHALAIWIPPLAFP